MLTYSDILKALDDGNHVTFAVGANGCAWTAYKPEAQSLAWGNHPEPLARALHAICAVWALGRAAGEAGFVHA